MNWRKIFTFVLVYFLGFVTHHYYVSDAPKQKTEYEITQNKALVVLTPEMIEDYYRLQTLEEKYKKADELLGKVIVALLHDLGNKLNKSTIQMAESSAKGLGHQNSNSQTQEAYPDLNSERTQGVGASPNSNQAVEANLNTKKWQIFEPNLEQVQTNVQANEFLEKVKIDNFDEALKASSNFKNSQQNLENIIGKFEGSAEVSYSSKARIWQIEIEMDLRMNQQTLRGRSQIKLSENGRVFSNSTDRGEPKNIREFSNESVAIMIRASPSIIFQLYYLKTNDSFIGNVYRLDGDEINYKYVGTLKLNRKN